MDRYSQGPISIATGYKRTRASAFELVRDARVAPPPTPPLSVQRHVYFSSRERETENETNTLICTHPVHCDVAWGTQAGPTSGKLAEPTAPRRPLSHPVRVRALFSIKPVGGGRVM